MNERDDQWRSLLTFDPLPPLLDCGIKSIVSMTRSTLLDEPVALEELWVDPGAKTLVARQQADGGWDYPSKQTRAAADNYRLYQTFKNLGTLVEKHGFKNASQTIQRAADYVFAHQTDEGDIRGVYDKQYSPNYSAAFAELLIKAGYADDPRLERLFRWLISVRQHGGGWALPFRTQGYNIDVTYDFSETIQPDLTKPFSHMVTGVVLRAFAAHPNYRHTQEARQAGELLAESLFASDTYPDRRDPSFWLQFTFPFCYTDLISALDALSILGFSADDPRIERGLNWFVDCQSKNGIWPLKITAGGNKERSQLWLALAICRVFKRFHDLDNHVGA